MKALDVAVFMWLLQFSLFVVGSATGYVSVSQPEPLISLRDINEVLVGGGSPSEVFNTMFGSILAAIAVAGLASRLLGLNAAITVVVLFGVALGLFMFGRTVYYAVNMGSLLEAILESALPGLDVPAGLVLAMNAVMWLVTFIALVDLWRGQPTRQMG